MIRFPMALSLWRSLFLTMRFMLALMVSTMAWNSLTSSFRVFMWQIDNMAGERRVGIAEREWEGGGVW